MSTEVYFIKATLIPVQFFYLLSITLRLKIFENDQNLLKLCLRD